MANWPTTLFLAFLALMAVAASLMALANVRRNNRQVDRWQRGLTLACGFGGLGLFLYRWALLDRGSTPLVAHLDGLLLVAILLAGAIEVAHVRRGLAHLDIFALPVLSLILAWAFCASRWTFRLFDLSAGGARPGWLVAHLAVVYVGTVCLAVAAVGGAMYLYLEKRVRRRMALPTAAGWGSLERIEWLMRRAAAGGFALVGLALFTGAAVALSGQSDLGPNWWYSPKVILAVVVWLMTGVLVGVRYAGRFRGRRAAWLSIAALVLMLLVMALAIALQARAGRERIRVVEADGPSPSPRAALPRGEGKLPQCGSAGEGGLLCINLGGTEDPSPDSGKPEPPSPRCHGPTGRGVKAGARPTSDRVWPCG